MVEHQLQDAQRCEAQRTLEKLDQEFLVTKTVAIDQGGVRPTGDEQDRSEANHQG